MVTMPQRNHQAVGLVCVDPPDDLGSVLVDNLHARPAIKGTGRGPCIDASAKAILLPGASMTPTARLKSAPKPIP
jgi:hypothetical protein